ncbi:MAG: 3-carboxy-cis,cis-muconate cycloisomerase [Proteobacteria bacterium]|nr:3-carboxy-cis,cis-muconate cycloisomerase [Pseudomonadota bacterium]
MIDAGFSTEAMRALFTPAGLAQRMLAFEAALARAEARCGVIPATAADAIAATCAHAAIDTDALSAGIRVGGNKAIPFVAQLTKAVPEPARGYVHWGATSQDVLDTAAVLQWRDALALLSRQLDAFGDALDAAVARYADTVMPGRTWMQQALPVTLGLKLAGTLSAVTRARARLAPLRDDVAVLQFGGAAGTLASLGADGEAVEAALAQVLGLAVADTPWHTQRDRPCDIAAWLAGLIALTGKLARDIALLAQTEVAEAFEPAAPGRGGSSTLPHKRNPVGCALALAAATRAPGLLATMYAAAVQEHERGLGNWPAEWDTLPDLFELAAGAVDAMTDVITGLDVDAARMATNLEATGGQILAESVQMALATKIGRGEAHARIAALCKDAGARHEPLLETLARDAVVSAHCDRAALAELLTPARYLGSSARYIARVRRHWKER